MAPSNATPAESEFSSIAPKRDNLYLRTKFLSRAATSAGSKATDGAHCQHRR
jgi:hypothetical protein